MKLLLDTHALLWWLLADQRLSTNARRVIASAENEVFVSSASGWEISTKHRLGKLPGLGFTPDELPTLLRRARCDVLPIGLEHAVVAGALPAHHRDPFDRMLVAQSRAEALPLVTRDPIFHAYEVQVLW